MSTENKICRLLDDAQCGAKRVSLHIDHQTFNDFNIGQRLNILDNNNKDSIRKLEKRNKKSC